jgi:pimeloyl-ACP methyl ester carboxylesterase
VGLTLHPTDALVFLLAALLLVTVAASWPGFVVQAVDRQIRVPWTRDRLAALSREAALRALFVALRPFGRWWPLPPPALARRADRSAVLLVPDPDWGRISMLFLGATLAHRGHPIEVMAWGGAEPTLPRCADELAAALARLAAQDGRERVDVVAFDYGGVIAGWAARHLPEGGRIRRLVTIGTPWHGTKMAVFRRGPSAEVLRAGGVLLEGLLPVAAPTVSVWTPDDPQIIPATSAVADPDLAVSIEGTGHLGLLLSARVFRAVASALEAEEVAEPPTSPPEADPTPTPASAAPESSP